LAGNSPAHAEALQGVAGMSGNDYRKRMARLYGSARWKKLREWQLATEPLCAFCAERGRTTPATVADHVKPHRGDEHAFWNGPFQSLCASCHSSDKQSQERTGKRPVRFGPDGWPL